MLGNTTISETAEYSTQWFVEDELAAPNLRDPYFFDHPLDHLPGTFLVSETLAIAAQRTGHCPSRISRCQYAWHDFAEFEQSITCRALINEESFNGELFQNRLISTFSVDWDSDTSQPISGGQHPEQLVKPKPLVVHKSREENIFIANCHRNKDNKLQCCLLAPQREHQLAESSELVHPLLLLEGCKQLLTAAGQSMLAGFSMGGPQSKYQLILKGFLLELFCPIATSAKIDLHLESYDLRKWRRNVPKVASFVVAVKVGTAVVGQIELDSRVVEPDFFRYLRSSTK